jgi:hypothetical protein
MRHPHSGVVSALVSAALAFLATTSAAGDTPRTREEIEAFMRTAKVKAVRDSPKGVTRPLRLTLSDGTFSHDASFQAIDERKPFMKGADGRSEVNFVDSWRYNLAAYRLAELLGLAEMMPTTIEYRYRNRPGSLTWWMESLMDEGERLKKKVEPPNQALWNEDMLRMRVFMELVHDTDRNLGNVLVSPEWRVLMVDFTRAFRLHAEIQSKDIERCDRGLLARLEALTLGAVKQAVGEYLNGSEAEAVMKRRDLIVAHVRALIAERGEDKVLY